MRLDIGELKKRVEELIVYIPEEESELLLTTRKKATNFLMNLDEDMLYLIMSLMYIGRSGGSVEDLLIGARHYKNNSNGKKIDVEQIIQKRPLIKYLEKGIENLENID